MLSSIGSLRSSTSPSVNNNNTSPGSTSKLDGSALRPLLRRADRRASGGSALLVILVVLATVSGLVGWVLDTVDNNRGLARYDKSAAEWGAADATANSTRILRAITELGATRETEGFLDRERCRLVISFGPHFGGLRMLGGTGVRRRSSLLASDASLRCSPSNNDFHCCRHLSRTPRGALVNRRRSWHLHWLGVVCIGDRCVRRADIAARRNRRAA